MNVLSDRSKPSGGRTLVICPSRARVGNIAALLDCWELTEATAQLAVCLDVDDPDLNAYLDVIGDRAEVVVGEWRSLCDWVNHVSFVLDWASDFDIVGQFGDDNHPRTPGWDRAVADAMQPMGVVYGNDLHQGERLPTAAFVDAEIIHRLGYMVPPEIQHLYMDNYFKALGERLGTLTYLPDVVIEHMHPHAGKAAMDDGYRDVNSRHAYRAGRSGFERYMATRFDEDIARLQ